jgi:hypothetical protein
MMRWIDQAASSAVTGLPLENVASVRTLSVMSLPSGETVHSVASMGSSLSMLLGFVWIRLS